jgi:hypothetical protein
VKPFIGRVALYLSLMSEKAVLSIGQTVSPGPCSVSSGISGEYGIGTYMLTVQVEAVASRCTKKSINIVTFAKTVAK